MSNPPQGVEPDGLFDGAEVISVYSDAQALDDGVIVNIGSAGARFRGLPINRMTRALFSDMKPFAAEDGAYSGEVLASILRVKCQLARGSEDNSGEVGDIYRIPPNLWLVRNEVSGWTAMYPEDY